MALLYIKLHHIWLGHIAYPSNWQIKPTECCTAEARLVTDDFHLHPSCSPGEGRGAKILLAFGIFGNLSAGIYNEVRAGQPKSRGEK